MENLKEKLPFIINPNLRLNSPNFNISWHLVDFNILFPQAYLDEVILHEMAHLKYMHHRKSFWQHLSGLLGRDANQAKIESSLFFCKYAELFYFIMKK
ncbi:MAG: M48 family metallopeptidase [Bacteroidaceae bacterium]|nr:M48 family metallopeptidase [Bacteroidaceae bacterium]